jgi:uncharacterized protein
MDKQAVIDHTRRWIRAFVIGLNLCPFARRVFEADRIRYVVSDAADEARLLEDLAGELQALRASPLEQVETTLLIHPHVLGDFLDYNDFLGVVEKVLTDMDLDGIIQVASFHPGYRFAGSEPDAAENYTNRSPYPMLHLLRETSVSQVAGNPDELREIPRRNIATMNALGVEQIVRKLRAIDDGHVAEPT